MESCISSPANTRRLILTYLIPCHPLTTHTLPTDALLAPYPRLQTLFLPLSRCIKKGDLAGFDAALAAGEDEFVKRRIYLTLERGRDIALRNLLRKVFLAGGFEESKVPGGEMVRRTRIPRTEFAAAISIGGKETMDEDEVECLLATMIYKVSLFSLFSLPPFSILSFPKSLFFYCLGSWSSRQQLPSSDEPLSSSPRRHPHWTEDIGPFNPSTPSQPKHTPNESRLKNTQNLMKGYIARGHGMVVLSKGGAFPGTNV
jgi:hypothetical protein